MLVSVVCCVLCGALGVLGDVTDNSDGSSGSPPELSSYLSVTASSFTGYDAHAVHAIQLADSSIVAVGVGLEGDPDSPNSNSNTDGFIIKTKSTCDYTSSSYPILVDPSEGSSCETYDWVRKIGSENKVDKMLWVVELDSESLIAVGVVAQATTNYHNRYVVKLNKATGAIIWEYQVPEASATTRGGFESVEVTGDGGFVCGGFTASQTPSNELYFKSSGQIEDGTGVINKFSAAAASSSSAPTGTEWEYLTDSEDYPGSVKAMRVDSDGSILGVVGVRTSIVKVSSTGTEVWNTGTTLHAHGQANDLTLVSDGFITVGHVYGSTSADGCSECSTITGILVKCDQSGTQVWTKTHGNPSGGQHQFADLTPGPAGLIYDECYGIQNTADASGAVDGVVFACGTGIEGCDLEGLSSNLISQCQSDPRRVWRAMVTKADLNGDLVWRRVENFVYDGEATVASSAAEYVAVTSNGGAMVVTDEANGFGWITVGPTGGGSDDADDNNDGGDDGDSGDSSGSGDEGNESNGDGSTTSGTVGLAGSGASLIALVTLPAILSCL